MDTIKSSQIRAARGLLNWTRDQLVTASGVPKSTLVRVETEATTPRQSTLCAIRAALEAAGVEFTDGDAPGVRLLGPATLALKKRKAAEQEMIDRSGIPRAQFIPRDGSELKAQPAPVPQQKKQ
ncbi:MAG: helix-turn-helix transcriptional regulator [Acetobacter sp.]